MHAGTPYLLRADEVKGDKRIFYGVFRPIPPIEEGIGLLAHVVITVMHESAEGLGKFLGAFPEEVHNSLGTEKPEKIPEYGKMPAIRDPTDPNKNYTIDVKFQNLTPAEIALVNQGIKKEKPHLSVEDLK